MNKPISPAADGGLRKRFIEDMTVRGFTEKTRRSYIRIVSGFAACLGRSPDTATDIRRFQVHQCELGMHAPGMNGNVAALRFFFTQTLDRPDLSRKLIRLRYPRKLPSVLSAEEVARLLVATKYLARARPLLAVPSPVAPVEAADPPDPRPPCPCCGARMMVLEAPPRWLPARGPPKAPTPTRTVTPWPGMARTNILPSSPCGGYRAPVCRNVRGRHSTRSVQVNASNLPSPDPRVAPISRAESPRTSILDRAKIITVAPVGSANFRNPHKHPTADRGFVLRRLSYAKRRPKLFTMRTVRFRALRPREQTSAREAERRLGLAGSDLVAARSPRNPG